MADGSMAYKRLLVAIDLGAASDKIAIKAATMARTQQAEIHILHIVEPLSLTYGADLHVDTSSLQAEINEQAEIHLQDLATQLSIPNQHCHLASGRPEKEIPAVARRIAADLIVLGSHGRWGLELLLGTTTDGVVSAAECDVLAIRVERDK
ncbi:MAG: universal stress protein [Luminiphilus sp.]|nr:universal stress protein [Luminiphilus sp.]